MFYTVLENQMGADGTFGLLYNHFTDENQALSNFFTVCALASQSSLPYHSAHLLTCDGRIIRQEIFDRREESQPTPSEETEE